MMDELNDTLPTATGEHEATEGQQGYRGRFGDRISHTYYRYTHPAICINKLPADDVDTRGWL